MPSENQESDPLDMSPSRRDDQNDPLWLPPASTETIMREKVRPYLLGTSGVQRHNLRVAILHAEAGAYVLPVTADKVPLIPRFQIADDAIDSTERTKAIDEHRKKHKGERPVHVGATRSAFALRKMWTAFPNALPAVSCGPTGVVVVDADEKVSGPKKIRELTRTNGGASKDVPVTMTQNKGLHLFYKNTHDLTSGYPEFRKQYGADVKGRGSQVLLPGAVTVEGKRYESAGGYASLFEALRNDAIPDLPDFMFAAITAGKGAAPKRDPLDYETPEDDPLDYETDEADPLDIDEVNVPKWLPSALAKIDNSDNADIDYEQWVKVGAAIHYETKGSDEGKELFEEWSAQSPKHVDAKFEKTWASFGRTNKVTVTGASIKNLAEQAGWAQNASSKFGAVNDDDDAVDLTVSGERTKALLECEDCTRELAALAKELYDRTPIDLSTRERRRIVVAAMTSLEGVAVSTAEAQRALKAAGLQVYSFLYADDILDETPEPVEYLIDGVATRGEIIVGVGAPGSCKTTDMLHKALCIATGSPYHGRDTSQGGTMFVGGENSAEEKRRIRADIKLHARGRGIPLGTYFKPIRLYNKDGNPTTDEKEIIRLANEMATRGTPCKYIGIDNLRVVTSPGSTSDEGVISSVMVALQRIRNATGATVEILHHTVRDGNRYAGSGAIESHSDTVTFYDYDKANKCGVVSFGVKMRMGDGATKIRFATELVQTTVDTKGDPVLTVTCSAKDPDAKQYAVIEKLEKGRDTTTASNGRRGRKLGKTDTTLAVVLKAAETVAKVKAAGGDIISVTFSKADVTAEVNDTRRAAGDAELAESTVRSALDRALSGGSLEAVEPETDGPERRKGGQPKPRPPKLYRLQVQPEDSNDDRLQ